MKLSLILIVLFSLVTKATSTSFVYQGTATDSAGQAISGPMSLKIQIGGFDGSSNFCELWQETLTGIPVNSAGSFQVEVGSGASFYNISFLDSLSKLSFTSVSPATTCGTSFSVTAPRYVRVYYYNGTTFVALYIADNR